MAKTVLITGASRGIGKATALKFFSKGYNVIINYNNSFKEAKELEDYINSNGGKALSIKADVGCVTEVSQMYKTIYKNFNSVDVIVNNAGVSFTGLIQDTDEAIYDKLFSVNMKGAYLVTNKALPDMILKKSGKIINVSSMWGERGASCEVIYSASKSALIGYTKALAKELGPSGITVNAVLPGVIDTDMNSRLSKADLEDLASATPLSRIGKAEEVADLIYYLASDEASFITGQIIGVDGGFVG